MKFRGEWKKLNNFAINYQICPYCRGIARNPLNLIVLCPVCEGEGRIEKYPNQRACPVCRGMGRDILSGSLCPKCHGFGALDREPIRGPINLFYISGEKPYSDYRTVENILEEVTGNVLICDPYFGKNTLDLIKRLPNKCKVRFLLEKNQDVSEDDLKRYKQERPSFQFKLARPKGMHDRYIVDKRGLMILGHGLRDIGNKESFVVFLERSLIPTIIDDISISFENRWKSATSIF